MDCQRWADQVAKGRFEFLNTAVEYPEQVDWNDPKQTQLWRLHLHYFDYALALGAAYQRTHDQSYYTVYRRLVLDWTSRYRVIRGDGWLPYAISRRIENWIYSCLLFQAELEQDRPFYDLVLKSLYFQARYLARNLEFDLLGNHLLVNAKALYFAGRFFEDQHMLERGSRLLKEQAEEQILPDGGHFERSPMYHCLVLLDFLDCLAWPASENASLETIRAKAQEMLGFLRRIVLPNGEIPLFNDSALNMAPSPRQLFSYAGEILGDVAPEPVKGLRPSHWTGAASGYAVMRSQEAFMIVDGGPIGPAYQPGHGHCDLFSYELVLGDEKLIVDSGVYEYEEGEMRPYCRGTRAHNTVMVDEQEQSEIWKSFRVARRAYPHDVDFSRKGDVLVFRGWHGGYRHMGKGLTHARWIAWLDEKAWFICDRISGHGKHTVQSFIHFHPSVRLGHNSGLIKAYGNSCVLSVLPFGFSGEELLHGWYCPEFGKRVANKVLMLTNMTSLPVECGYLLIPGLVDQAELSTDNHGRYTIVVNNRHWVVDLREGSVGSCRV
jgi:uncharacterized heparinase superfamily protein